MNAARLASLWRVLRGPAAAPGIQSKPVTSSTLAAPYVRHRIISLSMVKNEQDIIEPFIRHNSRFVDCMILLDNASLDDTRRIAMDCARELGTIIVADSEEFGYTQAERLTRLLQFCQTAFFADFILFLDADEFLSANDKTALLATLEAIPVTGIGLLPWQTFVLHPSHDIIAEDPPRSIRRRRAIEAPLYHKAVLRLGGAYRPDIRVEQGSHDITTMTGDRLPTVRLDTLPLLHFPVRSRQQIIAKGVVGWMAYLARNPAAREMSEGFQWREVFDQAASTVSGPGGIEPCEISMLYAQHPRIIDWKADTIPGEPPSDYRRRYSTGAFSDPLALIARSWERSLLKGSKVLDIVRPATTPPAPGAAATSFDAAWHWDNLFVDVAPFRFIAEKYRPDDVLDIGCGIGAYLKLFQRFGARNVLGLDGIPVDSTVRVGDEYLVRDLSQPLEIGRRFDLVVCVEVAEHLEERHSDILLDTITRHARGTILFSAAGPDQPGHGYTRA